jgi:hypothetical protein
VNRSGLDLRVYGVLPTHRLNWAGNLHLRGAAIGEGRVGLGIHLIRFKIALNHTRRDVHKRHMSLYFPISVHL